MSDWDVVARFIVHQVMEHFPGVRLYLHRLEAERPHYVVTTLAEHLETIPGPARVTATFMLEGDPTLAISEAQREKDRYELAEQLRLVEQLKLEQLMGSWEKEFPREETFEEETFEERVRRMTSEQWDKKEKDR